MVVDEAVRETVVRSTAGIVVVGAEPVLTGLFVERLVTDGFVPRVEAVDSFTSPAADEVVIAFPPPDPAAALGSGWPQFLASVPVTNPLVVLASPSVPLRRSILDRPAVAGLVVIDSANVSSYRQIRKAIEYAAAGDRVIDAPFRDPGVFLSDLELFTPNERSVFRFVGEGLSNAGISAEMFISERTVEGHVRSIFSKIGLVERPEVNRRVIAALAARSSFGSGR
jgi:DNA-binding CsgD family transcriptional regulator